MRLLLGCSAGLLHGQYPPNGRRRHAGQSAVDLDLVRAELALQSLVKYLDAAVAFAAQPAPDEPTFDRYAEAVAGLPTRPGGTQLEKWTVLTWLPFIANPAHHMFLKPQLTQEFASALPFELQYRPQLNFTTYRRLQEMSSLLKDSISDPELNPAQRELDMIDVQSFMWMVTQYGK